MPTTIAKLQDKSLSITSNGEYTVRPDTGYTAIHKLDLSVDAHDAAPTPEEVYANTRPNDWLVMPPEESVNDNEIYALFQFPKTSDAQFRFQGSGVTIQLGVTDSQGVFTADDTKTVIGNNGTTSITILASDWGNETSDGNLQVMIKASKSTLTNFRFTGDYNDYDVSSVVEIRMKATSYSDYFTSPSPSGSEPGSLVLLNLQYLDWIGVNNLSLLHIRNSFMYSKLKAVLNLYIPNDVSLDYLFYYSGIESVRLTLAGNNTTNYMFYGCRNLKNILLTGESTLSLYQVTFGYNSQLRRLPKIKALDTSNNTGIYIQNMDLLEEIPLFTMSSYVTTISFSNCKSLKRIALLDTSNITSLRETFLGCKSLVTIPKLNTSNVTNFNSMFSNCSNLEYVPDIDISSGTDFSSMFYSCTNLKQIDINTSRFNSADANNTRSIFYCCYSLEKLDGIPLSSGTVAGCISCKEIINAKIYSSMQFPFQASIQMYNLRKLLFDSSTPVSGAYIGWQSHIKYIPYENLVSMLQSLPQATTSSTLYMSGNSTNYLLTEEDKAIATNKGWVLTL